MYHHHHLYHHHHHYHYLYHHHHLYHHRYHQPTLTVVCSVEKDRLPKLKKLVKTDLHTYQLYKVIGEGSSYGIVYESEIEDGWIS
ncbi:unnamed protein product [Brugia pahangi]|uniref:Uncharacterized protein n=1 Tax=Brugia pahangi TaxID=6280 RepID=A0A3P7UXB4_BRUPA|nr:unnamed protein product [Brugia pahangi]